MNDAGNKKAVDEVGAEQAYNTLGEAIDIVNCVFYATHATACPDEIGNPIRSSLDVAIDKLKEVKSTLHDMVEWA